jgi:hypothetical protein
VPARMSARHRPVDLAGPRSKIATADRLVHQEHAAPGPRRQLQHVLGIGQILRRASLAYQRKAGSVGHIRRHAVPTVVDYVEVWLPQLEVFQVEVVSAVGKPIAERRSPQVSMSDGGRLSQDPLEVRRYLVGDGVSGQNDPELFVGFDVNRGGWWILQHEEGGRRNLGGG